MLADSDATPPHPLRGEVAKRDKQPTLDRQALRHATDPSSERL